MTKILPEFSSRLLPQFNEFFLDIFSMKIFCFLGLSISVSVHFTCYIVNNSLGKKFVKSRKQSRTKSRPDVLSSVLKTVLFLYICMPFDIIFKNRWTFFINFCLHFCSGSVHYSFFTFERKFCHLTKNFITTARWNGFNQKVVTKAKE